MDFEAVFGLLPTRRVLIGEPVPHAEGIDSIEAVFGTLPSRLDQGVAAPHEAVDIGQVFDELPNRVRRFECKPSPMR